MCRSATSSLGVDGKRATGHAGLTVCVSERSLPEANRGDLACGLDVYAPIAGWQCLSGGGGDGYSSYAAAAMEFITETVVADLATGKADDRLPRFDAGYIAGVSCPADRMSSNLEVPQRLSVSDGCRLCRPVGYISVYL